MYRSYCVGRAIEIFFNSPKSKNTGTAAASLCFLFAR